MATKLIEICRTLRKQLQEQRRSAILFASPALRATLEQVNFLLLELEDLDDRVVLLERAASGRVPKLIDERANAPGS